MPDQDLSRLGRVPLWAWLVIAVVIIGVIASALGAGGDDDGGGSGETGGKYDQTWTTSYQATTCEQWLNQMSPQQRFAGAADMLTGTDVLFLLGADEMDFSKKTAFTVYIGSHGDNAAHVADVILPGATYTEKSGTWVNTEGRVQMGNRAGFAPGDAREDWAILRALSDVLGKKLPFDSLLQLRAKLYEAHPHFAGIDEIAAGNIADLSALAKKGGTMANSGFASPVKDFYLTNPIARASAVMAECSALARNNFKVAAE